MIEFQTAYAMIISSSPNRSFLNRRAYNAFVSTSTNAVLYVRIGSELDICDQSRKGKAIG